jgi:hypothetical protein
MHSKDGFHCCYNVQTAGDGGNHLIAEYEVITAPTRGYSRKQRRAPRGCCRLRQSRQ